MSFSSFIWVLVLFWGEAHARSLVSTTNPLVIVLNERSFESTLGANLHRYVGYYNQEREVFAYNGNKRGRIQNYYNSFRYGIANRFEMRLGANYYQKYFWDQDGQPEDIPDSSGFSWLTGGGRFAFFRSSKQSLALDIDVRQFLETRSYPDENQGTDGLFFRAGGVGAYHIVGGLYAGGDVGVTVSQKDMGMELDFDVSARWNQGAFAVGGGAEGAISLRSQSNDRSSRVGNYTFSKDSEGTDPLLRYLSKTGGVDGKSEYYRFYGALDLLLGSGFHLEFKMGQTFWGKSWPHEGFGELNLVYRSSSFNFFRKKRNESFKQYEHSAKIIKVSPRGSLVKIDAGLSSGITKGMVFDIYEEDHLDKRVLVASGRVYQSNADTAIIRITKVYREDRPIAKGFMARGSP